MSAVISRPARCARFALALVFALTAASACLRAAESPSFVPLFPKDGLPEGWSVRQWNDVSLPAEAGVHWGVTNGVLHGSEPRGTWLVSEREFGDFILEFEWKLGPRGNSGCGLRFPAKGDPAFDGLELQMVDPRYFPPDMKVLPEELSGGLYRAIAPRQQLFQPERWNVYHITCRGRQVTVVLNGTTIQEVNLDDQTRLPKRHDNTDAPPLKDRPRRGHIGFQELSRGGGHVEIRNARILELK